MINLNKDTTLCISLSARPSHFGTRFHNFLYNEMGLNYAYKACTTTCLEDGIRGIRGLGIRGCGLSMPYKEEALKYLDHIEESAQALGAVNTIVNKEGTLYGYNTDFIAVSELLTRNEVATGLRTAILGSGGMAKAICAALSGLGFKDCTLFSRNESTGSALAYAYGFRWQKEGSMSGKYDFLINATPIGMHPDPEGTLSFTKVRIAEAQVILESVANPTETALIKTARTAKKRVITGVDIVVLQAIEQFRLYTGKTPSPEQVKKATDYAYAQN